MRFVDLDPPPHGLLTLRARMARRRKRAAMFAGLVLGPAAATAALVAVLVQADAQAHAEASAPRFDHPALVKVEGVNVVVDGQSLAAVRVSDGVYLVP